MAFIEFEISKSGLFAAQRGLQNTMNNITNANTEGFSRRTLGQKAETPLGTVKAGMLGMGVQTTGVKRLRDSYIDQKIWSNNPLLGEYNIKVQQNYLLEAAFNEPSDTGFTTIFNTMFNAMSNLSINPSDDVNKINVKETMVNFSKYYNGISSTLSKYQQDLNFDIKNTVNKINSLAIEIRDLNEQIAQAEIYGSEASDFRDNRDKCLDDLSKLINIDVEENEIETKGVTVKRLTVRAAGQVLVDDRVCNTLEIKVRGEEESKVQLELDKLKQLYENNGNPDEAQVKEILIKIQNMSANARVNKETGNLEFTQRNGEVITLYERLDNGSAIFNDTGNGRLNPEDVDGLYDLEWSNGLKFYMCDSDMRGELKALIDMRDGSGSHGREVPNDTFNTYNGMPYYINRIDNYVRTFAKKMNDAYSSTEDGSILIQPYEIDADNQVTSIKLNDEGKIIEYVIEGTESSERQLTQEQLEQLEKEYKPRYVLFSSSSGDMAGTPVDSETIDYTQLNASNFTISKELFDDATQMRTVYNEENPSDTSFMIHLLQQKDNKDMFKEGDPKDYMIAIFAELGINTNEAEMFQATKNAVSLNLDNQRKSVSQVDTSEEFVYLIQYQQAYQASARMMTTIDAIYEITINRLGVN